ncbi:MAG: hypothetical protein LBU09_03220 [Endomicrobium sp.]|jgi:hypothetical protein|nr:hypothetical protein [Endomicrobium sp.]
MNRKRPFLIDKNLTIVKIFSNSDRKEYSDWQKSFNGFLSAYNKTEKIILFLKYNKGYSLLEIIKKTKLSRRKIYTFFVSFKSADQYDILRAKNKYAI